VTGGPAAGVTVFAPAKVNLALHVTGRRADGFHLLDSLVAFADIGDLLEVWRAAETSLDVQGPEAHGVPGGPENLVLRAAAMTGALPLGIRLDKRLPAEGGLGGGSADAAATLRAIAALGGPLPEPQTASKLGADVPMCLASRPSRARGVGERLAPVDALPPCPAVLVNPRVPVSTPAAFRALERRENPGLPGTLPAWAGPAELAGWLATQRNDLEAPARTLAPGIDAVLAGIAATRGCQLARMSGSGATCFGLYVADREARDAARTLAAMHPGWWVQSTRLGAPENTSPRPLKTTTAG